MAVRFSRMFRFARALCVAFALCLTNAPAPLAASDRGAVTNLPIPRFVSMKASEANIRRGPSLTHRVDWIFRHQGTPLIVTGEYGHWRRVVDRDGMGGWIHYALLSGTRTVIIDAETVELRKQPLDSAQVMARAEQNVIATLDECREGWCRIAAGGRRGWVPQAELWGVTLSTQ